MPRKSNFIFSFEREMTMQDLLDVALKGSPKEVAKLIVLLDKNMQDWGFTERMIAHFKFLEKQMQLELTDEKIAIKPKEIKA